MDFFAQFFIPSQSLEGNQELVIQGPKSAITSLSAESQKLTKIQISDDFLLSELIGSLTRVCETFPFLKSKTSSFIASSFHNIEITTIKKAMDFLNL